MIFYIVTELEVDGKDHTSIYQSGDRIHDTTFGLKRAFEYVSEVVKKERIMTFTVCVVN